MANIKELSKTKEVIVISHRLANVVLAERIYFMSAGELKEAGTHEELLQAGGGYAALYTMQKKLEEAGHE